MATITGAWEWRIGGEGENRRHTPLRRYRTFAIVLELYSILILPVSTQLLGWCY
jgi:hypothetical protein